MAQQYSYNTTVVVEFIVYVPGAYRHLALLRK